MMSRAAVCLGRHTKAWIICIFYILGTVLKEKALKERAIGYQFQLSLRMHKNFLMCALVPKNFTPNYLYLVKHM